MHYLANINKDQVYILQIVRTVVSFDLHCIQCSIYICGIQAFSLCGLVSASSSPEKRGLSVC